MTAAEHYRRPLDTGPRPMAAYWCHREKLRLPSEGSYFTALLYDCPRRPDGYLVAVRWLCVLLLVTTAWAADGELHHDDGVQAGKQSSAGTGHAVTFKKPRGVRWITSVRVYGSRYGGGYDPAETPVTVSICDAKLNLLSQKDTPYERFPSGRFEWVELDVEPIKAPRTFTVVVEFDPTATKGVFVGWSEADGESHSAYGLPGGTLRPFSGEWMIRVGLSKKKPRGLTTDRRGAYQRDFDFLARTIQKRFPAFEKKGVDWPAVLKRFAPAFKKAKDDKAHMRNVQRLLATLGDAHTTVAKGDAWSPAFVGLYGAGLWIAVEGNRLLVRASLHKHILPGTELLEIDGKPAHEVHEAVRQRLREWHGWSSDHFLDARLSFQFFPFDHRHALTCRVLEPDGDVKKLQLSRWGPGGKGVSRVHVTLPAGAAYARAAVAHKLNDDIGYLRITGAMNEATRKAFFEALDTLRGVKGILLDCRGMGGGGDGPAWAMAGRFAPKGIDKSGDWQFGGPVVMLQDERMISSAETFTWAMGESGRALTVGRPTGGATIIPRTFRAPSGLFEFRLGVTDRRTPFEKVQPEGIGTAPDIYVPYEPHLLETYGDPTLGVGRVALERLVAGQKRDTIVVELNRSYGLDEKHLLKAMIAWEERLAKHGHGDERKRRQLEERLARLLR